jgi:hypothetical protein
VIFSQLQSCECKIVSRFSEAVLISAMWDCLRNAGHEIHINASDGITILQCISVTSHRAVRKVTIMLQQHQNTQFRNHKQHVSRPSWCSVQCGSMHVKLVATRTSMNSPKIQDNLMLFFTSYLASFVSSSVALSFTNGDGCL